MAYIHGITASGGAGMVINIFNQDGTIALHFNPRFNENCIVRNSCIGGGWGSEERHGGLPFAPNQPYVAAITCQQQGYEIAINGRHFTQFNHRVAFNNTVTLEAKPAPQSVEYH